MRDLLTYVSMNNLSQTADSLFHSSLDPCQMTEESHTKGDDHGTDSATHIFASAASIEFGQNPIRNPTGNSEWMVFQESMLFPEGQELGSFDMGQENNEGDGWWIAGNLQ
jgi:hypothetical protein